MELIQRYQHDLSAARAYLLQEISSLNENEFNRFAVEDAWSIGQICHHLWKTEVLFTKAIVFGLKRKPISDAGRKAVEVVLDQAVKYRAPEIAEPDEGPFHVTELIWLLDGSRQQLLEVLVKIEDEAILKEIAVNHPRFGDLPLDQWIELLYMHEQRHAEQIKKLKAHL
ncbi:DinB family protein [Paenibacillus sp. NPDC057967]|uniref:DinB family protein n=1 Tax=Paenibacillus sp. NPDC057967 TaxID=3346293 RepID=UPI0036DF9EF0